jgi:hypothetical protein
LTICGKPKSKETKKCKTVWPTANNYLIMSQPLQLLRLTMRTGIAETHQALSEHCRQLRRFVPIKCKAMSSFPSDPDDGKWCYRPTRQALETFCDDSNQITQSHDKGRSAWQISYLTTSEKPIWPPPCDDDVKKTDVDHGLQMPSAKTQADHLLKFHIHNAKLTTSKKIQADHLFKNWSWPRF